MAQIANPYSGGNALYASMVNQLGQNKIGDSLANIGQTQNAGRLSELMAMNGGQTNASMSPLAMLSTPEAMQQFNAGENLQRTDRGLDLTEQNNLWGHQDRQATLGESKRQFNRNMTEKMNEIARNQKGYNQAYDRLVDINKDPMVGPLNEGVTERPMFVDPMYPERNGQDIYKPTYDNANNLFTTQQATEAAIAKAQATAAQTLAQKQATNQQQGMVDLIKSEMTNTTDPKVIQNGMDLLSKINAGGNVNIGDVNAGVQNTAIENDLDVTNKKLGLKTIQEQVKPEYQDGAISLMQKYGNIDGIRDEVNSDNYMGSKLTTVERQPLSTSALDILKEKGYDAQKYPNMFGSEDIKFNKIEAALRTVADQNLPKAAKLDNIYDLNRYFNKIGINVAGTRAGSNFTRTKNMDTALKIRKAMATKVAKIANVLVESDGIKLEEAKEEARRILKTDPDYMKMQESANEYKFPKAAYDAADALPFQE